MTLAEMLAKHGVAGNSCLEEVRKNAFAFAKNMGVLLQLCRGDMDATTVCEAPRIDFVVDGDDADYIEKLRAVAQRMQRERDGDEAELFAGGLGLRRAFTESAWQLAMNV